MLSEQQMRKVLGDLAARGLILMGRGKVGLRLTALGGSTMEVG